jgi:hypothetical protein
MFAMLFIVAVFTSGIFLFTLYVKQGSTSQGLNVALPESRLLDFKQEVSSFFNPKKTGSSFDKGNYEYDERTNDFRFVCTKPCPVSKTILDQEFAAISYAVSTLRGLTQSDIDPSIMPFEVHASEDGLCPLKYQAYKKLFRDKNGNLKGVLCFFFDKRTYNRDKFPYSTSIHEVMHLFQEGKYRRNSVINEGLSGMLDSFFLKGNERNSFCWQGNFWYVEVAENDHDPHWVGGKLFFNLCNQYGFDYNHLPALFRGLEAMSSTPTERDFVNVINDIVGDDTSHLFREAGVI